MYGEKYQELGRPYRFHESGKSIQPKEGRPKIGRESDEPILLGERESRLHGEGVHRNTQSAKETLTGLLDWRN